MKILVGCSSPPDVGAGGILTYVKEIISELIDAGNEIHVAAPAPENWEWINEHSEGFIETSQYENPFTSVKSLLAYINKNNIDAIINNDNPHVQSVLPAVNCPSLVVGHLGESVIASLACYQNEWTDYIVAISNDMFSSYVKKYNVPVTKCPIVFNGVKDNGCDIHDKTNVLKVVFAGGYNRRKGCMHILSMVEKYASQFDNLELNWFGYVPDKLRKKLSKYNFIEFHGRVPRDVFYQKLRSSDVLLFPSKSEGCPMAMLEAMSVGVVPIASDGKGAMQSLVLNGKEGYICHLDNWDSEAAQALKFLSKNRVVLESMMESVREKYLQQFQTKFVIKRLLELINNPTVLRNNIPDHIDVLSWHRPVPKGMKKSTLLNRLRYRLGILRKVGVLAINDMHE